MNMDKEKHAEETNSAEPDAAKTDKAIFRCHFCSQEFSSLGELKSHKNALHPALANSLADLEKIKAEIIKEIQPIESSRGPRWGGAVVGSILILLAFVSVAQAIQSYAIWQKLDNGAIQPASAQTAPSAAPASSLDSQPGMVGGC